MELKNKGKIIMAQILLVDDDKTFLNGLKMFFNMTNIQVSTATTVSKAKVLLDTEAISLIYTDWDLPDGTGYAGS
jgi:DNA-binding response OmpR family regulator